MWKIFQCKNRKTNQTVYNNGCIDYFIQGKFKSLKSLRTKLIKIKEVTVPF
jgi:hypothetical protein